MSKFWIVRQYQQICVALERRGNMVQTGAKGHFLPKCPSFQNSPPDCFGNSPLKGLNNASGGQGLWVSPAGSVGASAFGRGLHRRGRLPAGDPHPLDPASLLKKAWRKLYAMLYQTSVLCNFTSLLIYSINRKFFAQLFFKKAAGGVPPLPIRAHNLLVTQIQNPRPT